MMYMGKEIDMEKVLRVETIKTCKECWPYHSPYWVCNHPETHGRDTAEPSKQIQDWCPLADFKEECNHSDWIGLHGHPAALECKACGYIVEAL